MTIIDKIKKDAAIVAMKASQLTNEYFIRPYYGEIQIPVIPGMYRRQFCFREFFLFIKHY